jgi:hypothetical protein
VCEKSAQEQQEQLDVCKQKNIAIQKAMIRIFGKFEALMHLEGRVDYSDTQKRDMLLSA